MALDLYSLASLAEIKAHMGLAGDNKNDSLEAALNTASSIIESACDRQLVSRGGANASSTPLVEYHSIGASQEDRSQIYLGEWPVVSVASVYEDISRNYSASTLLTVDTDYIVTKPAGQPGRLRRVISSVSWPRAWFSGYRSIKVTYVAGYRDQAGKPETAPVVPADLKQAALFIAASIFQEAERKRWGISAVSDATGSTTRYMGWVPPSIDKDILQGYRRLEWSRTWERDS